MSDILDRKIAEAMKCEWISDHRRAVGRRGPGLA